MKIDISIKEGVYIATSEDLPGLFVADKNIIELFEEIPEVIKAIHVEERKITRDQLLKAEGFEPISEEEQKRKLVRESRIIT